MAHRVLIDTNLLTSSLKKVRLRTDIVSVDAHRHDHAAMIRESREALRHAAASARLEWVDVRGNTGREAVREVMKPIRAHIEKEKTRRVSP